MRWQDLRRSSNVEDRRGGRSTGGKVAIGGLGVIIVVVLGLLTGQDPTELLSNLQGQTQEQVGTQPGGPRPDDQMADFVTAVLGSTEDVWGQIYSDYNARYEPPALQIFDNATRSACGGASSATGPFYCPADQKVYIDLSFCDDLRDRFKAPGEFAVAYVIAHEVGHHIQNLMGINQQVEAQRGRLSQKAFNQLSVKQELQADFLAGVWAHHAQSMQNILEPGDLEAALTAANAIGDDKLQQQSQGYVVPDAFTHGTSQQRMYWFKKGYQTGDLNQGKMEDIQ